MKYSFIKDSSKNINKEYKVTIIYYIILLFKNDITEHFTDIINLVSDTIKHDELVGISLSILKLFIPFLLHSSKKTE